MIKCVAESCNLEVKSWKFPGGEVGVNVKSHPFMSDLGVGDVIVFASLTSSDDIMELMMVTDALKYKFNRARFSLFIGYLPYGRQDRRCNEGDSFSLRVMGNLINSLNYETVHVIDQHSIVSEAVIERCVPISQTNVFHLMYNEYVCHFDVDVIAAPDAGALKKSEHIFKTTKVFKDLVCANKVRDMETGNIIKYDFTGDVKGKTVVVVDDICDGGATFLLLGKKLKEAGAQKIILCVTHGIFSAGTSKLTEIYDMVISSNSYHYDRIGCVDGVYYCKVF